MNKSKYSRETLGEISVLMDGELDSGSEACLDRLLREPELRRVWARYQLIGEGLRCQAATATATPRSSPSPSKLSATAPFSSLSIAAGLGFVAVLLSFYLGLREPLPKVGNLAENSVDSQVKQDVAQAPLVEADAGSYENIKGDFSLLALNSRSRFFEGYRFSHKAYWVQLGGQGMMAYVQLLLGLQEEGPEVEEQEEEGVRTRALSSGRSRPFQLAFPRREG